MGWWPHVQRNPWLGAAAVLAGASLLAFILWAVGLSTVGLWMMAFSVVPAGAAVPLLRRHVRQRDTAVLWVFGGLGCTWTDAPSRNARAGSFRRLSCLSRQLRGGATGIDFIADGTIDGTAMQVVRHRCVLRTMRGSRDVEHWVVSTACPVDWPQATVTDEQLMAVFGQIVGYQDLTWARETFSRRWRVRCEDGAFLERFLNADVQMLLEAAPPGESWEIGGGWIRCIRQGSITPLEARSLAFRPSELCLLLPPELRTPFADAQGAERGAA